MSQFLQFARKLGMGLTLFGNGFSYVWEEANPEWVWSEDPQFKSEKVYVSCMLGEDIARVIRWSKANPEIQFTIGGPAVSVDIPQFVGGYPPNVHVSTGFAEEIFNRPVDLKTWKIEIPNVLHPIYAYHINGGCYWRNCTFCLFPKHDPRGYDLEPLSKAPPGLITFDCSSFPPNLINIFLDLPYDGGRSYQTFIRGSEEELEKFSKVIPKVPAEKLSFMIGVEFPSDRLLKEVNKGVTTKHLLDTIRYLVDSGCSVRMLFMTGWPNLIPEDLREARKFFDQVPKTKKIFTGHRPIHVRSPETNIIPNQELYPISENLRTRGLYGETFLLSPLAMELDKEYKDMLKDWVCLNETFKPDDMEEVPAGELPKHKEII